MLIRFLAHWGRVTHISVSKLSTIGSDNGLSPDRRQAITWTNAGLLLIGPLGTNFSEILFGIQTFSFKKMLFKMSSAKWRPFCFGLNVLKVIHMNAKLDNICKLARANPQQYTKNMKFVHMFPDVLYIFHINNI